MQETLESIGKRFGKKVVSNSSDTPFRNISIDSRTIKEGDIFRQTDLANTLSKIRMNGSIEFYRGKFAESFVARPRHRQCPTRQ